MAENTAIEWCDSTFNPWWGCTKISPACDNCYAAALDKRTGGDHWGNVPRRRTGASNWNLPLRWQRQAGKFMDEHGRRRRVFCASMADVFDNQVPTEWRDDLWALIRDCADLDWLLLTKRPQNIRKMLPPDWGASWPNVWLGTTVENQDVADRNIPILLSVRAQVRFVSIEPLLGPVDLTAIPTGGRIGNAVICDDVLSAPPDMQSGSRIDWVIAGGESGPGARPSHPDWFRSLRDQCAAAGVPFLFKQWGEYGPTSDANGPYMARFGKKATGRLLDGAEHNGFPEGW